MLLVVMLYEVLIAYVLFLLHQYSVDINSSMNSEALALLVYYL
jgi:hypothetical protein